MMILFDVGNVIMMGDHKRTHNYLQRKYNIDKAKAERFYGQEYHDFSRGKISGQEFCDSLRKILNKQITNDELRKAHDIHIYKFDDDVIRLIENLHQMKIRIGFLTDTNIWQTGVEKEGVDLEKYAEPKDIFRSHEIGMLKMDDPFPYVLEKLDIPPSEILYVDDIKEYVNLAVSNGLTAIQYLSPDNLRDRLHRMHLFS